MNSKCLVLFPPKAKPVQSSRLMNKLISNSLEIFGKNSKGVGKLANLTFGILLILLINSFADNEIKLFDQFIENEEKKSLAFEVTIRPKINTLSEDEIEKISANNIGAVENATGGKLRG